jgi:P22 tail accessory factor
MITNAELIRDALILINVLGIGEAAEPEHSEHALRALNALLADWEADGVNLQFYPQTMDELGAQCPIPDDAELAVKYYLAFALAPGYGKQVDPKMLALGAQYYGRLTRESVISKMQPASLTNLPIGEGQRIVTNIVDG